ncbi:hypothetical protein [Persephonella sp.]
MNVLFTALFTAVMILLPSYGDNLQLVGKVIKVEGNKLTIKVFTHSCKGKREFILSENLDIDPESLKNKRRISFIINKPTCKTEEPIVIEAVGGIKK